MATSILLVDGQAIYREPLAALLCAKGFDCTMASSATEALDLFRAHPADLVILEIQLEGMHGLDLVGCLRHIARGVPVIVLTDSRNKEHVVRAAGLAIHDYLLKCQFSTERLLTRITALVGPPEAGAANQAVTTPRVTSPAATREPTQPTTLVAPPLPQSPAATSDRAACPKLLKREQTLQRVDQVAAGKTIAGIVAQVIALANSPDTDLPDLVKILESDPVLATRVMQLANSASTGGRVRIRSIDDAVRTIGVREISNLAINIGVFGSFPPNEIDGFNSLRCWQHSFAVADLVNLISTERDSNQACTNHLAGLCHDLGELLLRQHFSAEYDTILRFAVENRLPVHEVEGMALGVRHPELLSRLLSRIGLPQPVVHTIREFYERQIRGQAAGMSSGVRALAMANQLAHGMLLAASTLAEIGPISRTEWRALSSDRPPPTIDPVAKRNEILAVTNFLARLPEKDERQLLLPLVPRHGQRIWYLRPEMFIELDPLEFALSLTGDLTVSKTLPTPDQWQQIDAVVAVGIRFGVTPIILAELVQARAGAKRPELPILALAGQDEPAPGYAAVTTRPYPLRLKDLDSWLSGVSKAPNPPQEAPAGT